MNHKEVVNAAWRRRGLVSLNCKPSYKKTKMSKPMHCICIRMYIHRHRYSESCILFLACQSQLALIYQHLPDSRTTSPTYVCSSWLKSLSQLPRFPIDTTSKIQAHTFPAHKNNLCVHLHYYLYCFQFSFRFNILFLLM